MNRKIMMAAGGVVLAVLVIWGITSLGKKQVTEASRPETNTNAKDLYQLAVSLKEDGRILDSQKTYQQILQQHPDYEGIENVQKELETLNLNIIFSSVQTPETVIHEVQNGDTLGKLARKYNTTVDLIKKSNGLNSDIIRLGQKLRIWTGTFNIFVDKSQNILILKDGDAVLKVYRVSTGKNNNTPIGEFKIVNKLIDPVWYQSGAIIPPESPQNVLGSRWLGFDLPGYGIHGTVDSGTIGQQVTAGCVRMHNKDVEELFSLVPTGTLVKIVD